MNGHRPKNGISRDAPVRQQHAIRPLTSFCCVGCLGSRLADHSGAACGGMQTATSRKVSFFVQLGLFVKTAHNTSYLATYEVGSATRVLLALSAFTSRGRTGTKSLPTHKGAKGNANEPFYTSTGYLYTSTSPNCPSFVMTELRLSPSRSLAHERACRVGSYALVCMAARGGDTHPSRALASVCHLARQGPQLAHCAARRARACGEDFHRLPRRRRRRVRRAERRREIIPPVAAP